MFRREYDKIRNSLDHHIMFWYVKEKRAETDQDRQICKAKLEAFLTADKIVSRCHVEQHIE